jgi:alpha-glucosidase
MRSKRVIVLSVLAILLSVSLAVAQWQSIGDVDSFTRQEFGVTLKSGSSLVNISILAPDLVRVRASRVGVFLPDRSAAVMKTDWSGARFDLRDIESELRLETSELTVIVQKRPLRISFLAKDGALLNADDTERGMSWSGSALRVWKSMPQTEQIYGLGEKACSLNRKYRHLTMWNTDIPAYKADTDTLYQTIPFFYGIDGGRAYGIFFDNSYWSSFDMGKEFPDRYSFGAVGGEINYYFMYGPAPKKVLGRFTELVGRMPLPPLWSLGYQQCRWSYSPESRVRKLAADFRSKKIPCDVIYLDIDYMEGYRIFTWSKANFPDPKTMIGDLAKDGFKVVAIVDPGIKVDTSYAAYRTGNAEDLFLEYPDGRTYTGKVWPGLCAFPDFSNGRTRVWWGKNMEALTSVGVRGFWNDMNEPSVFDVPTKTVDLEVLHDDGGLRTPHSKNHNLYGLLMTQASYEGALRQRPNERPFILTRASYAGGQRYSAAWTGDNIASWEHLEMAVPMMLGLSISGQPYVGSDIGGFVDSPDGELYARWLQLGVFSPLMRTHTAWGTKDQEPWSYGAEFEAINKHSIELRYTLLPYIYGAMRVASETGIPPMRPLAFDFPENQGYAYNATEFMFGEGLLVAPVLWPGARTRSITLPPGTWYNYWSGERYQGGNRIEVAAPIDRIPIFARAGAVIPTQQVVQYTDQSPIDPLTLTVYAGENAQYEYYEDDGLSFEYQKGKYARRTIEFALDHGKGELILGETSGSYRPRSRSVVLRFVGIEQKPTVVKISGVALTAVEPQVLERVARGWTYDSSNKTLRVKLEDRPSREVVTFE